MKYRLKSFGVKGISISLFCLFLLTACGAGSKVYSEGKDRFIVKFDKEVSETRKEAILSALGLKADQKLDFINAVGCVGTGQFSFEELLQEGEKYPEVKYIEPDFPVYVQ